MFKFPYKPITNTAWVHARLCKLQKGCTRLAVASDKVYGRHDIAQILRKVALNSKNQIKQSLNLLSLTDHNYR
jgi:hypothetical protein